MNLKKITAIIKTEQLEGLENRLKDLGVPGLTVDFVQGYGEYANFFARDWMSRYARLEIVVDAGEVDRIVEAIIGSVHTGTTGDGVVYTTPVDHLYRIRDHRRQ